MPEKELTQTIFLWCGLSVLMCRTASWMRKCFHYFWAFQFGEVSFCHTNVQDHFQRFLSTREGGGVNWEMAKLVLFAELCSVLQLRQKGNEWRERQTGNPLLETELKWADNLLCAAGLLSLAGKQWASMNTWRWLVPYQHGESVAVVYGAGQDGRGVAKVSLEIAVCVAVGQQ